MKTIVQVDKKLFIKLRVCLVLYSILCFKKLLSPELNTCFCLAIIFTKLIVPSPEQRRCCYFFQQPSIEYLDQSQMFFKPHQFWQLINLSILWFNLIAWIYVSEINFEISQWALIICEKEKGTPMIQGWQFRLVASLYTPRCSCSTHQQRRGNDTTVHC